MKVIRHTYLMMLLVLVVLALAVPGFKASAAGPAVVTVSAPLQPVSPGTQFTVAITIQPKNNMVGAQFDLSFDPALVSVNSISEGNLLKQNGNTTYFMPGRVDNHTGSISGVAGTITNPNQSVSTPGTFAVIALTAGSSTGSCTLTLSKVIIGDMYAQALPVNLVNAIVNIENGNDQPPVLAPIGNKTVDAGSALNFTISATDPDSDPLTYSASNLPPGAGFEDSTRSFAWTPSAAQVGTYSNVQFKVSDGTLSASENITITVKSTAPAGGGGGGGAPAASSAPTPTPETSLLNRNGAFDRTVQVKSSDKSAVVTIDQGTKGLTKDGKSFSQIEIQTTTPAVDSPERANIVGSVYNLGPDGATFDHPVTLTLTYNRSLIPAGINENDLVIAFFEIASNSWVVLESTVNPGDSTITAKTNHFSTYAILAHPRLAASSSGKPVAPPVEGLVSGQTTVSANTTNSSNISSPDNLISPSPSAVAPLPSSGTASSGLPVTSSGNNLPQSASATALTPAPSEVPSFSLSLLAEEIGGAVLLMFGVTLVILLRRRQLLNRNKNLVLRNHIVKLLR